MVITVGSAWDNVIYIQILISSDHLNYLTVSDHSSHLGSHIFNLAGLVTLLEERLGRLNYYLAPLSHQGLHFSDLEGVARIAQSR